MYKRGQAAGKTQAGASGRWSLGVHVDARYAERSDSPRGGSFTVDSDCSST